MEDGPLFCINCVKNALILAKSVLHIFLYFYIFYFYFI